MPICINFLAEAQAEEEQRRKDPVKRAILAGSMVVLIVFVWAAVLQLRIFARSSTLSRLEGQIEQEEANYTVIRGSLDETFRIKSKLTSLHKLATNRFLNGTLLDAMQETTIADVQLLRMRLAQSYALTEAVKARTNGSKVIPAKPATSTESIKLTLEARDASVSPGNEQVNKYKETLSKYDFFLEPFEATNGFRLVNLAPPTVTDETGRAFVLFTLECKFPQVTR